MLTAIVELAVRHKADDLRTSIDDDNDVLRLARRHRTRVRSPAALRSAIGQREFHRAAGNGPQRKS